MAARLLAEQRPVVLVARDHEQADDARAHLMLAAHDAGRVTVVVADTTDPDDLPTRSRSAAERWGRVAGLVTAAGRLARGSTLALPVDDLRDALDTNVVGT